MSFQSTSSDVPSLLHVSFAKYDKDATLGAQLVNCDIPPPNPSVATNAPIKEGTNESPVDKYMFTPGYAIVGKLIGGDNTVAKRAGVKKGDIIIAVNGLGFRRFAQDYNENQITVIQTTNSKADGGEESTENGTSNEDTKTEETTTTATSEEDIMMVNHRVVPPGNAYTELLAKIKTVKAAGGDPPLVLTMERYGWDARPNSWYRFLIARDHNVPAAMQMLQEHELWKQRMFPIDLVTRGMQKLMREKIISEIDIYHTNDTNTTTAPDPSSPSNGGITTVTSTDEVDAALFPRTVYVNYGKLLSMQTAGDISVDDIVRAFVIFTERQLQNHSISNDPRHPKTNQFIDLSGVSITTTGFRVDILKQIYNTFEPNYPETLHKMVIYPVSTLMATTARTLLNFVNEKTKKKFLITNNLELACSELGWDAAEVQECGGITEFMYKHEKAGTSFFYD